MTSRRAAILLGVGIVLLIAGAIGFFLVARPMLFPPQAPTSIPPPSATPRPTFEPSTLVITPPPSLEDLAAQYPEIAPLLLDPELSSVYKEFLAAYQAGGIEAARDLARRRGILDGQDRVRLTLELDSADPIVVEALSAELKANGIEVLGVYQNKMDVGVPVAVIEAAAAQENPGAVFAGLTQLDHVIRVSIPIKTQPRDDPVVGEGVNWTGAELWHQVGRTGKGIKIGILDLGFAGYKELLGAGLPATVVAASFVPGEEPEDAATVHGTACAEIIHEMAPDAELYLAYYDGGDVAFGQAVDWLLSQGVQIISHSAGGSVGPMDGTESDAMIVDWVTSQGILWVNASGNEADVHYRGTFTDTNGDGWHEFPDGEDNIGLMTGVNGAYIMLNWDDWAEVNQDFDLYVFDEQGNLIGASEDIQNGGSGQWAAEGVLDYSVPAETVLYAAIRATDASRPVTFDLYIGGFGIEFPVPEHSLTHPGDARTSFTVGAIEGFDNILADYSSQGPTNDGRLKPDISAPAGVRTVSYAPEAFHGTSASTPHVAGAAALVWAENPSFTADQIKQYLIDNALDLQTAGPDSQTGYGALHLPAPPGAVPIAPVTGGDASGSLAAIALVTLCGGFFCCGGALVLVGGVALVVSLGRRPSRAPTLPPYAPPRPQPVSPASSATMIETAAAVRPRLQSAGGTIYDLPTREITVGRSTECEIAFERSSLMSRRHATLRPEGAGWVIIDLGSSNGTFVNGQRLKPTRAYPLNPGDQILLGGAGGEQLTFAA